MACSQFVVTAFAVSLSARVVELPSYICLQQLIEARKLPDYL
ncbi:MAG TPA: hypothetical protein VJW20_09125 [Candidatus Angelobacter sp.]|nr:hypothetical protein [Candidatus Angelobacter sp.]